MNDTVLRLRNVSKRFRILKEQKTLFRLSGALFSGKSLKEDLWALRDINLDITRGEKIGLVGRNGAGKTTLLRVLSGIFRATSGTIRSEEKITPLLRYNVGLHPCLPVIDNAYVLGAFYGMSSREMDSKLDAIIRFAELEQLLYVPIKDLSSGQLQRLCFSTFIQSEFNFLAFDESTSMADKTFQQKAAGYFNDLMHSNKTIILCSHSLQSIRDHCSRVIWMENGQVRMDGETHAVTRAYTEFCENISRDSRTPEDARVLITAGTPA